MLKKGEEVKISTQRSKSKNEAFLGSVKGIYTTKKGARYAMISLAFETDAK